MCHRREQVDDGTLAEPLIERIPRIDETVGEQHQAVAASPRHHALVDGRVAEPDGWNDRRQSHALPIGAYTKGVRMTGIGKAHFTGARIDHGVAHGNRHLGRRQLLVQRPPHRVECDGGVEGCLHVNRRSTEGQRHHER